jgi:hypothetical protein
MSQKMSTLDKKERNNIEDELGSKAAAMGMDMYESYGSSPEQKKLKELVGMCFNCNNLSYCASEFATVFAKCEAFNFKLSGQNRIVECNLHSPKGVLSLNEMYSIATLIDPEKENKVGFTAKPKSKGMKT